MKISVNFLHLNQKSKHQYQRIFGMLVAGMFYLAPAMITPWLTVAMILLTCELWVNDNHYSLIADDDIRDGISGACQTLSLLGIIFAMVLYWTTA